MIANIRTIPRTLEARLREYLTSIRDLAMALKAVLAMALVFCAPAGSAEKPEARTTLEEVIVTAQKREQSLQDVGVSVAALVRERVQELGIVSSTDVALFTPGLRYTVPNGESSQVNFFLRGVGLNDFADANETRWRSM